MNQFLSSGRGITHNKYNRLMLIACLDTLVNLPIIITSIVTSIVEGKDSALNYPYISWKNVHDGTGGLYPGSSLSSILQLPAASGGWSTNKWEFFTVKWNEWVPVLSAVIFFCVFGTTTEMRQHYRSVFWFIPERLGYKRQRVSDVKTVSAIAFNLNLGGNCSTANT